MSRPCLFVLVEDSPFEEPSHKELEKWGRSKLVEDANSADLLVRVFETGTMDPVPVGVVNTGSGIIILDVVHPASKIGIYRQLSRA